MHRAPAEALRILLALALWGCIEPPAAFEPIGLEEARELIERGQTVLVQAVDPEDPEPGMLPGGVRWRLGEGDAAVPPDLRGGDLLVVATSRKVGFRCAGVLAGSREGVVRVFVPASAEERRSLYASASETQEVARGRDS